VKTTAHNGKTVEYIEVTLEDIETANRLAHEVLGRSIDELPPQTRRLLLMVDEMASKECMHLQMDRTDYRFSRRDVRQYTGWGDTQLRVHLGRLEDLEYLLVHRGGRGQSFVYELVFERSANDDNPMLPGLIDVEKLKSYGYDKKNAGIREEFAASNRPQIGGVAGGSRVDPQPIKTGLRRGFGRFNGKNTDTGLRENEPVVTIAAGAR
jgi:hypothetical protein